MDYASLTELLTALSVGLGGAEHPEVNAQLARLRQIVESTGLPTLEPLLPLSLQLNGKPYSLRNYRPFSPMFRTSMPATTLLITGRQVSKSTSLAASGVMLANGIPNHKLLYLTPLYEQIRRFSTNYVRPFIDQSPLRSRWIGTNTENSVLQRSFKNHALMIFSFALLDASRIRGVAADAVNIDEIQDFDIDHLPIVQETMSASDWSTVHFAGTPKSNDNLIEKLWQQSSMAEWIIPCYSCGFWNIPALEHHIDGMIGPVHEGICPQYPGTVCYRCRKSINPSYGHWEHRYRDRVLDFAGYHVPQIILPLHYARPDRWKVLCAKRAGWGNTPLNVFYNEVLGESVDTGQKLITEASLKAACILPWWNQKMPDGECMARVDHYQFRVLSVDWGGGGEEGVSFTVISVLGFRSDGKIDVIWGKRLLTPNEHLREALEIRHWMQVFRCHLLAHDYTGAGIVRETVLVQSGMGVEQIMPIQYARGASKSYVKYVEPTPIHGRGFYRMDKPRSLLYTCQAIKLGLVRFFRWDSEDKKSPGLIGDFLALQSEKVETRIAGEIFVVTRNPMLSDDFAQSVNIGCAALWHIYGIPNFAEAAGLARLTGAQIAAAGNEDYGWDEDPGMREYFNKP